MAHQLDRLVEALSDRYRIERELGSGGMATVYLAEDLKHSRKVAVKVLRPELAASLGAERFLREIAITAQLNHPNILTLIDSGAVDGTLYYVMPYLEGESLRDRLNRERQLPVDDAVAITKEVADALGYAHSRGLIHRDIKPENIMFEAGHAVVTDFGIARAVTAAGGETLTETGLAVGTPAYMSPEQATGERDIDARSDVYSLGCVLYEMLAGDAPYVASTPQAVIAKKLAEPTPRISVVREVVPYGVEVALERALAKTPVDRFTTADQFVEALETPAVRVPLKKGRKLLTGVAAAVVMIAVVAAALLLTRGSGGALDPNRVLVVELTDNSGREETSGLGRWAQDYIIQVLTEAGFAEVVDPYTALVVSQNVAAAGVAGGAGEILALADDARAGTVVSGRYYAAGDSIFIQTRITGAGRTLETIGVAGPLSTPSELFARLAQGVVAALATLLDQDIGPWEPTVQPASFEAYQLYNEGLEAYVRAGTSNWADAARQFERAALADPTFHRAALWAAQSYALVGGMRGDWSIVLKAESLLAPLRESPDQLSRYERCKLDLVTSIVWRPSLADQYRADRCMAEEAPGSDEAKVELAGTLMRLNRPAEAIRLYRGLDPDRGLMKSGALYSLYLCIAYHALGDYEGQLEAARQGMQRFPGSTVDFLQLEATALAALGRLDDLAAVLDSVRSAPSPDNLGGRLMAVAWELRAHSQFDQAREVLDEATVWFQSRLPEERWGLGDALYSAERWDDAERLFKELSEEDPDNLYYLTALAVLAARRGDRGEVARITELHRSLTGPFIRPHTIFRARIAALLGEREEAMTLLQQWADLGLAPDTYVTFLHRHIDFESLHDYPPFQEFMRPKG